jgi:hypothetical protein
MKVQRMVLTGIAAMLLLGAPFAAHAQRFGSPRIVATIQYEVIVGDVRLEPGEYEIRELGFQNPVFQVFSNDKLMVEAVAVPVSAEDKQVAETTKVTLQKVGNNYYLDKIWIEGKQTGFEFALPKDALSLQRELEDASKQ